MKYSIHAYKPVLSMSPSVPFELHIGRVFQEANGQYVLDYKRYPNGRKRFFAIEEISMIIGSFEEPTISHWNITTEKEQRKAEQTWNTNRKAGTELIFDDLHPAAEAT